MSYNHAELLDRYGRRLKALHPLTGWTRNFRHAMATAGWAARAGYASQARASRATARMILYRRRLTLLAYSDAHGMSVDEAISRAVRYGYVLNTYNDPLQDGHEGCSEEYARTVANEDPSLVYLTDMNRAELHEIAGRTFVLTPDSGSAWTFKEVLADGSVVEPDDLIGCHANKGFVLFHIRSQLTTASEEIR